MSQILPNPCCCKKCRKCCLPPAELGLTVRLFHDPENPGVYGCDDTVFEYLYGGLYQYSGNQPTPVTGIPGGLFRHNYTRYSGTGPNTITLSQCAEFDSDILEKGTWSAHAPGDEEEQLASLDLNGLVVSCVSNQDLDPWRSILPSFDSGEVEVCSVLVDGDAQSHAATAQISWEGAPDDSHIPPDSAMWGTCKPCEVKTLLECPDMSTEISAASGNEFVVGLKAMSNWICCKQHQNGISTGINTTNRITIDPSPADILNGLVTVLPSVGEGVVPDFETIKYSMWATQVSGTNLHLYCEETTDEPEGALPSCHQGLYRMPDYIVDHDGKAWFILCRYCNDPAKESNPDPAENCITGTAPSCNGWRAVLMWIKDGVAFDAPDMAKVLLFDPGIQGAMYQGGISNLHPIFHDKLATMAAGPAFLETLFPGQNYRIADGLHEVPADKVWTTQPGEYCVHYVHAEDWYLYAAKCAGGIASGPLGLGVEPPTSPIFADSLGATYYDAAVYPIGTMRHCVELGDEVAPGPYTYPEACP